MSNLEEKMTDLTSRGQIKEEEPAEEPGIKKEYPMVGMKLWVKVPSENLCKRQLLPTPDP
jgi:hypothetical protein